MDTDSMNLLADLIKRTLSANPSNSDNLSAGLTIQTIKIPVVLLGSLLQSGRINTEQYEKVMRFSYNDRLATLHIPSVTWDELLKGLSVLMGTEMYLNLHNKYHPSAVVPPSWIVLSQAVTGGVMVIVSSWKIFCTQKSAARIRDRLAGFEGLERELEQLLREL